MQRCGFNQIVLTSLLNIATSFVKTKDVAMLAKDVAMLGKTLLDVKSLSRLKRKHCTAHDIFMDINTYFVII